MRHLIILLFLCLPLFSFTQNVINISFSGLQRSKEEALHRLVLQPIDEPLNLSTVTADVRRLSNSAGIIWAGYQLDTLTQGIHLTYELKEGITRYPIALIGGLEDNFWWEAGYQDQNWRGRGDAITLLIRQIDGRLGGKIAYQQNYVRHHQWGLGGQLERYSSQEPLYFGNEQVDYFYDNHNVGVSWKYYFQPEEDLQVGLTYFVEDYAKVISEQVPGPDQRREKKQLFRLGYHLKQLHYNIYQPSGFDLSFSGELVTQKGVSPPFYLLRAIWKRYRSLGEYGLLASRTTLGYSANKNTPFAPFVVDSRINIRGAGNRVDRGTALLILNLEYRHLLYRKPWFAVQAIVFSDVGSWRNPGGEINDIWQGENIKCFMGAGLRIISDKAQQAVLRIDYGYGLRPIGRRGFVLGLGQYF